MWAYFNAAPWVVRWLVVSATVGLITAAVWSLALPDQAAAMGWAWGLGVLAGFSVLIGALTTALLHPIQQTYARAIDGLSHSQRVQAGRALRGGPIPTDPQVLAAAVRLGDIAMAYSTRSPWQLAAQWAPPVLLTGLAIWAFLSGDRREGIAFVGFALIMIAASAWRRYAGRRGQARLKLLRSAARADPQASALITDGAALAALPGRRRWWLVSGLVVVVVIAVASVSYASVRPRPDCRTAHAAVALIAKNQDLLNAWLITPSGPSLSTYEDWSNQLDRYSAQVSDADVAPHLRRIGDLSKQAVVLVQDARQGPSPSPEVARERRLDYTNTIEQMFDEERALIAACRM